MKGHHMQHSTSLINKFFKKSLIIIGLSLTIAAPINALAASEMPNEDSVKGAKDHPLLSRFTGAKLVGQVVKEFDEAELVAGKYVSKDGKSGYEKMQTVEGKYTRIIYCYPKDRSSVEVMRNYQAAIQKAGLKTLFACDKAACGDDFGDKMLEQIDKNGFRGEGETGWYASPFNYGRDDSRYILASGKRSDGSPIYAAVYVTGPVSGELGGVYVQIVEPKAMETDKVSVNLNAEDMSKGLAAEGKIALYGLYFDTGKALIKPESKPQLAEMAALMQKDAALKVYIVGHTDNVGAAATNVTLSQQRADAVVKALVSEYKISAARLAAKGVASFAPIASNDNDAGKAKNRRVELVKQ
jgi:OmpA-OmpF porin, OOP family